MNVAGPSQSQLQTLETYQSTTSSRLKSLYSEIARQKHTNPAAFSSNVQWWRRTLEAVVLNGWQAESDRLVLHATGPTMKESFRVEGVGTPMGLATVITELSQIECFFPLTQFRTSKQSIYDLGWLPYRIASFVVGKPLWWALQQLSIIDADGAAGGYEGDVQRWKRAKGDYVVVSLLEQAADAVLRKQEDKAGASASLADTLYSFESFKKEFGACAFGEFELSALDIRVLVKFLERDKQVVVVQGEVIKFINETSTSGRQVSAVDIGVLELKLAVNKLEATIDRLQEQIDDRAARVLIALKQKRKEVALSHLRAKKQFEDLLKKRLNTLDTLHATLLRVEAAAGDVEILKSYESSTATLRAILAHPSLQREKIEETMDAMASANADAREIDDAIRTNVDMAQAEASAGIDEAELEDELAALVREAEDEKAANSRPEIETKLSAGELKTPSHIPAAKDTRTKETEAA